jgi:hypothetical protein
MDVELDVAVVREEITGELNEVVARREEPDLGEESARIEGHWGNFFCESR